MKKSLLLFCLILFSGIYIQAQDILTEELLQQLQIQNYVPFHLYLQQHAADFQQRSKTRGTVYKKIGYRHDLNPTSTWSVSDSGTYNYTTDAWLTEADSLSVYNTHSLKNYTKSIYTYDPNGNQLANIHQKYDTTAHIWVNSSQVIKTFNSANLVLSNINQIWNSGAWVNVNRVTNYWDVNNSFTGSLTEVWNSGAWVNSSQIINVVHDGNQNLLDEVVQSWVSGAWVNSGKYHLTWTSNNKLNVFSSQLWNSGAWVDNAKTEYSWDSNDLEKGYLSTSWNTGTSHWDSTYRFSFTYNSDKKNLSTIGEKWVGGVLTNWYEYFETYDINNNWITHEYLFWNGAWSPAYKDHYTYDSNNNPVYELNNQWSNTDNDYTIDIGRYYFYYQTFNVSDVTQVKNELNVTLYPNPGTGDIYLDMNTKGNSNLEVNIYDALGKMVSNEIVYTVTGTNHLQLNYPGMSTGNYFVQITDQKTGKSSVLKFVKQ